MAKNSFGFISSFTVSPFLSPSRLRFSWMKAEPTSLLSIAAAVTLTKSIMMKRA
jgi:hypothetical protein